MRTGIFLVSYADHYGPVCQFGQLAKKQQTIEAQQDHSDDHRFVPTNCVLRRRQAAVRSDAVAAVVSGSEGIFPDKLPRNSATSDAFCIRRFGSFSRR